MLLNDKERWKYLDVQYLEWKLWINLSGREYMDIGFWSGNIYCNILLPDFAEFSGGYAPENETIFCVHNNDADNHSSVII